MKKLIAIAALFSAPFAFAANNTFTFQVNSSGADTYVCGFNFTNDRAIQNERYATGHTPQYSGSFVTWEEETVNTWTGEVTETKTFTKNAETFMPGSDMIRGKLISKKYDTQMMGNILEYQRISKLTFNLSDEYFGDSFSVHVCYNAPLFMDLSQVKFKVKMNSQFKNMTDAGRNYLDKALIETGFFMTPYLITDDGLKNAGASEMTLVGIQDGNLGFRREIKFSNFPSLGQEGQIIAAYTYDEHAKGKRPHLKHGGDFTITTDVVPVAK